MSQHGDDETKKYARALNEMYSHEWLFPDHRGLKDKHGGPIAPPLTSDEYLLHFSNRKPLLMMRAVAPYKSGFLHEHKDKVVFSSQLSAESMVMPYSVLQWSREAHVICDWVWSHKDEQFLFPTSIFCASPHDFLAIIQKNKSHEFLGAEKQNQVGFHVQR